MSTVTISLFPLITLQTQADLPKVFETVLCKGTHKDVSHVFILASRHLKEVFSGFYLKISNEAGVPLPWLVQVHVQVVVVSKAIIHGSLTPKSTPCTNAKRTHTHTHTPDLLKLPIWKKLWTGDAAQFSVACDVQAVAVTSDGSGMKCYDGDICTDVQL